MTSAWAARFFAYSRSFSSRWPVQETPDDADRPAKWYFGLKQALLESRRTGQPMKHPMSGPLTLRWKS